jgi:NADPH:quinone reductase-like Zn-dependent oxidoreductase
MNLGELLDDGKVVPVIEKCYPLSEIPEAIRYLAEGHARGKVVIQISLSS